MELSQTKHKASKLASKDFISCMPDIVVTNILNRVPLQDAVGTSILSRSWRFKWTLLEQLVFDKNFYKYLVKTNGQSSYGRIISRLVLHCAITKFVYYIEGESYSVPDDEDLNHWILFLSRKGIKDLTLEKKNGMEALKLPIHLFSCLELKHLKLYNCCFDLPPSSYGFPNLLSLELQLVNFKRWEFGKFITMCPSLEILDLGFIIPDGKVKLVEIAKLTNLKILSLLLYNLKNTILESSGIIFELVSFLPKLQELHLDFTCFKFTKCGANKKLPATLPCVKTLKLSAIDLSAGTNLSNAFEMVRSFPNLYTLGIRTHNSDFVPKPTPGIRFPKLDFNTMGVLQLRNVEFTCSKCSESEEWLIKYLLASSPFLKEIVIIPRPGLQSDGKLMFARKLLKLHRASTAAEINLY